MPRKIADCRNFPSEKKCTLAISGEEDEVVRAAMDHAVSVHGHTRGKELEAEIRRSLKDESLKAAEGAEAGRQPSGGRAA